MHAAAEEFVGNKFSAEQPDMKRFEKGMQWLNSVAFSQDVYARSKSHAGIPVMLVVRPPGVPTNGVAPSRSASNSG